jgi:hypothetical protein
VIYYAKQISMKENMKNAVLKPAQWFFGLMLYKNNLKTI